MVSGIRAARLLCDHCVTSASPLFLTWKTAMYRTYLTGGSLQTRLIIFTDSSIGYCHCCYMTFLSPPIIAVILTQVGVGTGQSPALLPSQGETCGRASTAWAGSPALWPQVPPPTCGDNHICLMTKKPVWYPVTAHQYIQPVSIPCPLWLSQGVRVQENSEISHQLGPQASSPAAPFSLHPAPRRPRKDRGQHGNINPPH